MTANQINYVKHLEDVRSHKVNEQLAERQTAATELSARASSSQALTASKNADTNVLNADTNRISAEASQMSALASQTMAAASMMNAQTERMYKEAQVLLEQSKQEENVRHNQATESKDLLSIGETKRHNQNTEWQAMFDTTTKSGIESANRTERAREADQTFDVTKRGQNLGVVNTIINGAVSLLKPKAGSIGKLLGGK